MRTGIKNKTAFSFTKNNMNGKTYKLRSKIIEIIYAAKEKVKLPRIEVRVVSGGEPNICGYAYLSTNVVHINEKYIGSENSNDLKHIVLHEIVHAVKGVGHIESCYLMQPYKPKNVDLEKSWKAFESYFK